MRDTTQRVSSDSIAKLQQFIVPTLKVRYQQQSSPHAALILPALLFRFMQLRQRGELQFEYQDRALNEVPFDAIFASDDPLQAFIQEKTLFGSLAANPQFTQDMRQAPERVDSGLKQAQGQS